jgi:predicted DCC family thiol-disulfide oxidoreductase YuxK
MKTHGKILLYDDYCPLCTWYSGLFVKYGLLKNENRIAFSKADLSVLTAIDIEKGKDEIPLYDPCTRQTLYGIDALLEILGLKIPFIKTVGNSRPVKWLLKKIYKLISYNRKVIVAKKCGPGTFDCSPGYNSFYRIAFLAVFLLFNSLMLIPLHDRVFSKLSFYHLNSRQLETGHLVFVVINCAMAGLLNKRMAVEYLGQVNMIALISILLLSALMLLNSVLSVSEWIILLNLGGITLFIVKEYFRRMKYAGIITSHKNFVWINIACLLIFLGYVFH